MPGGTVTAPARPARHTTWNGVEQVVTQPAGFDVNTNTVVTVATVAKVEPPLRRSANVAVCVCDVVGHVEATSLTQVYVPRNVTRSL